MLRKTFPVLVVVVTLCFLVLFSAAVAEDDNSMYAVTNSFSVRVPDGWTVENDGYFTYENSDVRYEVDFFVTGLKDTSVLNSSNRPEYLQAALERFFKNNFEQAASENAFISSVNLDGREGLVFVATGKYLAGYLCFDQEDNIVMILIAGFQRRTNEVDPLNRKDLLLYMLGVDTAQVYSHGETPFDVQVPSDYEIIEESDSRIVARQRTDTYIFVLQIWTHDFSQSADMLDLMSYDDVLTSCWKSFESKLTEAGYTVERGEFRDRYTIPLDGSYTIGEALEITNERPEGGMLSSYLQFLGTDPDGGDLMVAFVPGGYQYKTVMLTVRKLSPDLNALMEEIVVY